MSVPARASSPGVHRWFTGRDILLVRYPSLYDFIIYIRHLYAYLDTLQFSMFSQSVSAMSFPLGQGLRDTTANPWRRSSKHWGGRKLLTLKTASREIEYTSVRCGRRKTIESGRRLYLQKWAGSLQCQLFCPQICCFFLRTCDILIFSRIPRTFSDHFCSRHTCMVDKMWPRGGGTWSFLVYWRRKTRSTLGPVLLSAIRGPCFVVRVDAVHEF